MRAPQQFLHRKMWTVLLTVAAACALSPRPVPAQSTPIGPNIDICSLEWVDPYGYVWQNTCIAGDGSSIEAYTDVESNDWGYVPEVDSVTGMWDSNGTYSAYSGWAVQDLGEQAGTEALTGVYATPPTLNDVYTTQGEFGYCYDPTDQGGEGGDWWETGILECGWNYPGGYLEAGGVVTLPGSQGLLYPKYVVVGVTYAPPGSGPGPFGASNVQYTGTISVGTSSTNSTSFSNDLGYTIQVKDQFNGVGIPEGVTNADGSLTVTASQSTDWTQAQNSSTTDTFNKSTSNGYALSGYPTTYSPIGTPPPALPNDYDVIWLWLNPEMVFTAYPAAGNSSGFIEWQGYAYDPKDAPGVDIYPVQVGCLNGDFSAANCTTEQSVLNRSWVTNEISPTTGQSESPAILPNTQDAYDILSADPLAFNPGGSAYPPIDTSQTTTPDGRFTQLCWGGTNTCPNAVVYEPDLQKGPYTITQMNTQQQSHGGSTEIKSKTEVSVSASVGFLGLFNKATTWILADTVTQKNSWLDSLSQQQTIVNAFTVNGSDPPDYVAGQFVVYQDNQFGTFMFYPKQ